MARAVVRALLLVAVRGVRDDARGRASLLEAGRWLARPRAAELGGRWPVAPAWRPRGWRPAAVSAEQRGVFVDPPDEQELVRVKTMESTGMLPARLDVRLPSDWASRLDSEKGLRELPKAEAPPVGKGYRATLAVDRFADVILRVVPADDPMAGTEVSIRKRLAMMQLARLVPSWGTVPCLDARTVGDETLILLGAPDETLQALLRRQWMKQAQMDDGTFRMLLPLSYSLPIIVDVLRGIRSLELAGIVQAELDAEHIVLREGRAAIAEFGSACLIRESPFCVGEEDLRSAYRHAPEMEDGVPTGPSNMVWAVGLLAARMFLGVAATEQIRVAGDSEAARRQVRMIVRTLFSLNDVPNFKLLPGDIQSFLRGMLEKDPERRFSSEAALGVAMKLSSAHGVDLNGEPEWSSILSSQWLGEMT